VKRRKDIIIIIINKTLSTKTRNQGMKKNTSRERYNVNIILYTFYFQISIYYTGNIYFTYCFFHMKHICSSLTVLLSIEKIFKNLFLVFEVQKTEAIYS
jgi:cell division protein FtsB